MFGYKAAISGMYFKFAQIIKDGGVWKDDVDDISGDRAYSKDYSDLYETWQKMCRSLIVRVLT